MRGGSIEVPDLYRRGPAIRIKPMRVAPREDDEVALVHTKLSSLFKHESG
jgi:hypothetical protein